MRRAILIAASALALASPAVAADFSVTPYSEGPSYEREVYPYAYRPAPPVIVERRAVVVGPPPVVVEEYPYPFYAAPPVYAAPYAAPPVYAYAGPGWRGGWGHRRYFGGRW